MKVQLTTEYVKLELKFSQHTPAWNAL